MSTEHTTSVPLPKGVTVTLKADQLTVAGPLGKVTRTFPAAAIALKVSGDSAMLTLTLPGRRKTLAILATWEHHMKNMVLGVTKGFVAQAKMVSAHFPMKVYEKDGHVIIENFLGEKFPRRSPLVGTTKVEVAGEVLKFSGIDIEAVGQSVANMEKTTHIRNYDPRVFQDGIYITEKARPVE